jgi:hypothetical protein
MDEVEMANPAYLSFDQTNKSMNPYQEYKNYTDDGKFGRSLKKSDIEGASPSKFKHRPRKYFVDRQEIKSRYIM